MAWNASQLKGMLIAWLKGETVRVKNFEYSFADDAGAIGDITFSTDLPANVIVTRVESNETTAFTSGGSATITIKAGATSLTGAIAFDSGFTGVNNHALAGSVDGIELTAVTTLTFTIATAALTAGICEFFVEYKLTSGS